MPKILPNPKVTARRRRPASRESATVLNRGSLGFDCWRGKPGAMPAAHVHTDIEWNFLARGSITYLLAGRLQTLPPGRLGVFWAGAPHHIVRAERGTEMAWVTVPLAWFMQWELDKAFTQRLLRGELLIEPNERARAADDDRLNQWATDLKEHSTEARRIAAIEVEARLRRLARSVRRTGPRIPSRRNVDHQTGGQVERLASFVGQHYDEELSIQQIADAVGLHPNYAMNLFKRGCGMSLWEYLTRLRISHAQRLLLTTDWKIQRVALESGFGSPGRFYESFQRICGRTPRDYRQKMLVEN